MGEVVAMVTSGKDIGNMLARRRAEQREVYIFFKNEIGHVSA